ncbi:MAG: flagellin [Succinivibrio sp.]|nr:flagellin [Succinivibrio sp.]
MALYMTNVAMLSAQRNMSEIQSALTTSYQRLSSGKRINSAKDDPAGFQIASRLSSEINGLYQANRNANDAIGVMQTAEGALDEVKNMLQRIRSLALQSANGTNTSQTRKALNSEVSQLCDEITRIACQTTFGGAHLLNGTANVSGGATLVNSRGKLTFHIGANAYDTISVNNFSCGFTMSGIAQMQQLTLTSGMGLVFDQQTGGFRFSISTADNAEKAVLGIDKFISQIGQSQGDLGATQNRMESVIRINENVRVSLTDARSRIEDTDYAEEAANLAALTIRQQVVAMMMQRIMQSQNIILQLLQF